MFIMGMDDIDMLGGMLGKVNPLSWEALHLAGL